MQSVITILVSGVVLLGLLVATGKANPAVPSTRRGKIIALPPGSKHII